MRDYREMTMKHLLAFMLMCGFSVTGLAALKSKEIVYQVDGNEFTGYLVYDDAIQGKRPGVLVVHEWWGLNDYARKRADMLAKLGYTAFALDMYGTGKVADHPDDAKGFMQAVTSNMPEAEKRFDKAKSILQQQPTVDAAHIAAIGYCFGGGIVLHMARVGDDLDGVVSFHGSLGTQEPAKKGQVKARVLVFTGAADPFAPPELVSAFEQEMQQAGVDYQLISYPGVKHSFTNPDADSFGQRFGMPLAYDKHADEDSWQRTQAFFKQIFKD
jgi:dienelactone hydrolase